VSFVSCIRHSDAGPVLAFLSAGLRRQFGDQQREFSSSTIDMDCNYVIVRFQR